MKLAAFAIAGGLVAGLSMPVLADPIRVGCTAGPDCAAAMIAVDQGIFEELGIEVEMVRIAINSNIPPALLSNSIEIGGPTASVFLQAVDGGLDLVAVGGGSFMHAPLNQGTMAVVHNDVTIENAQDFVGKRVGVPGYGAYIHILFNRYLMENGVDPAQVNTVETSVASMPDVMRNGALDAVLAAGANAQRTLATGSAHAGPLFVQELGGDGPIIFYAATRQWAEANPELVDKFNEGIAKAIALAENDREILIASVAAFTEQDPDLVRSVPPSKYSSEITSDHLGWWIDLMSAQGLLQGNVKLDQLILQ